MEYPILTAPVYHPVVSTHQSTARSKIDMGQVVKLPMNLPYSEESPSSYTIYRLNGYPLATATG